MQTNPVINITTETDGNGGFTVYNQNNPDNPTIGYIEEITIGYTGFTAETTGFTAFNVDGARLNASGYASLAAATAAIIAEAL